MAYADLTPEEQHPIDLLVAAEAYEEATYTYDEVLYIDALFRIYRVNRNKTLAAHEEG